MKKCNYTEEMILDLVKERNFIMRKDFYKTEPTLYKLAKEKYNMLDMLFGIKRQIWNSDPVREEAAKYSTRGEFSKGKGRAYAIAKTLDLLDELFPKKIK